MSPLAPYGYEVHYADGRRLRWDSPGGPWGEARLPVTGLTRLVVLSPGTGPVVLPLAPWVTYAGLVLRQRGTLTLGRGAGHRRRWCFGVQPRAGTVEGVRIDDRGRVTRYRGPMADW